MSWLKSTFAAVLVAGLAFAAFMAASSAGRHKASARKWKERAVESAQGDAAEHTGAAQAALAQAKAADGRAKAATKKTKQRLTRLTAHDQTMADITSAWRKPK